MAGKKAEAWVLDDGVGVSLAPNPHGWGVDNAPHIAVLMHPIKGMSFWGPFVDEDAAHRWVRNDGEAAVLHFFGELTESKWHVNYICVPTHPKGC